MERKTRLMSFRQAIANRGVIVAILLLQVVPLLLFPAETFAPTTQEWWLPALLVVMALIASGERFTPPPRSLFGQAHIVRAVCSRYGRVWNQAGNASSPCA